MMRLRAENERSVAGSSALVILIIASVYGIGAVDRPGPVFGINLSDEDFEQIALGVTAILAGSLIVRLLMPVRPVNIARLTPTFIALPDRKLAVVAIIAMCFALVNYATSGIPILSNDVNGSRFAGNYGILGRLWPLILPTLQVVVVVAAVRLMAKKATRTWNVLGFLSFAFLIMSGGRSLFFVPLIAVALFAVDLLKPRFRTIVLLAGAGVGIIGAFGYARTLGSSGSESNIAYLGMRDQNSWLGSLDISVQTGPRVFSAAKESVLDSFLGGAFFIADFNNFVTGSTPSSDRLVTQLLNRDPNVVGGLPPTVFGGFYLDWGTAGIIFGALGLGFFLELFRRLSHSRMTLSSLVWTYYFSTYVLLSVYSYISAKPALIVVALLCLLCFDRYARGVREDLDDFEVSRLSRRC
jgi:oligosaccharide repeat unit polymerase